MRKSFLALCSSFALSSGLTTDLHAEEVLFESLKITTPNGELSDGFGRTVAVENNRIVVGAPLAGPTNAGSAYVFNTQTGSLINTLEFGNPLTSRFFGNAVALATGVTLIGAPNSFDGGAASLFVNGRESVLLPFSSENGHGHRCQR